MVTGASRVQCAQVRGHAYITDRARVTGGAVVQERAMVHQVAFVTDGAVVTGNAIVDGAVRGDVIVLDGHIRRHEDVADPLPRRRR